MSGLDALELREFAAAGEALREGCRVFSFDPINEFAAWVDNKSSFYFGDERRPTAITFDGDFGRALREEVAFERDVHPAVSPTGGTLQVSRLHGDSSIPIYVALSDLQGGEGRPRQMVERDEMSIWVEAKASLAEDLPGLANDLVSCIAYWLWQFTDRFSIPPVEDQEVLTVEVEVSDADDWTGAIPRTSAPMVHTSLDERGIGVVLGTGTSGSLFRADNYGEREIMRAILGQLDSLSRSRGQAGIDDIGALLDLRAPLGPKKMVNLFSDAVDASLVPVAHRARFVRDGLIDPLLDGVGLQVGRLVQSEVGPIPRSSHRKVFEVAVEANFGRLARLMSTLSPVGVLEQLVATHEALLHLEARQRYTFGARAACFDETELVKDLREEIPKAANAAIALRFLIELCVAVPPRGIRPGSTGVIDEAVALASQVVNHGYAGDIARFRLDDMQVSMLASGRVGLGRERGYHAGQAAFLDAAVPDMARHASRTYGSSWDPPSDPPPGLLDDIDDAANAEWGLSLSELFEFNSELIDMALPDPLMLVARRSLVASLVERLGWNRGKVDLAINLNALGPRSEFLHPPPPFSRTDVYPWRFNRALSYVRRPLLLRLDNSGEEELLWGPRHVERSGKYMLDLITSERLKAQSAEMKNLMTRLRHSESHEFVGSVAAICRDLGWPTQTNVRKIGRKRLRRANNNDLGDVDVLTADPKSRVVHALECKVLSGARTPAELANELNATFATGVKPHSSADIHTERVGYLRRNLADVLTQLGLDHAEDWEVRGRIVTDAELLGPYLHECQLPVTALPRLRVSLRPE